MFRPLILGTAGHIDHGKTALVRALTGIDTDRWEQEKQRGISIDIGFAHLELGVHQLGIVDVPGHERFIRNMLAGASGVDLALLVVAADDSVMPQTREHLSILELLRIEHGLIALTKSDLAEDSWLDLVEDDLRELVAGTFLDGAPIVRTSATTGTGLEELKQAIDTLCERAVREEPGDRFRLAIDRAFVLQGLGTVVTGTVGSGRISVGDELHLLPAGKTVRVRSLQSHDRDVETVVRGQRAAINLMGAHHSEIDRGCELATPGWLTPSRRMTVRLRTLPDSPWPIRHRSRVRVHLGTQEIMAEVRLLDQTALTPEQWGLAQLMTDDPAIAAGRQPLVLRAESPLRTIGGGFVLQPVAPPVRRRDETTLKRLADLSSEIASTRVEAAIRLYGHEPWTIDELRRDAHLDATNAESIIASLDAAGDLVSLALPNRTTRRLHTEVLADLEQRVCSALRKLHETSPLDSAFPRKRLSARLEYLPEEIVAGLIDRLNATKRLAGDEQAVALPDAAPKLTETQRRLREIVFEAWRAGGFSPPEPKAIASRAGMSEAQLRPILDLCVSEGMLVHVEAAMFLHAEHHAELKRRLAEAMAGADGLTMSQIRQALDTSRKYAVPICEHLDRIGFTRRQGDLRVLNEPSLTAETGA